MASLKEVVPIVAGTAAGNALDLTGVYLDNYFGKPSGTLTSPSTLTSVGGGAAAILASLYMKGMSKQAKDFLMLAGATAITRRALNVAAAKYVESLAGVQSRSFGVRSVPRSIPQRYAGTPMRGDLDVRLDR